jgi:hypothetical protein
MRILLKTLFFCCFSLGLFAQSVPFRNDNDKRTSITVGVLQGGGALVGADFEALLTSRVGLQAGTGLVGFGGGINYHVEPSIKSSFLSFQYWHQGIGERFSQNALGPNFVYRSQKWFTCQLGMGVPLSRGPALPANFQQPPVMLMYALGAYFPL